MIAQGNTQVSVLMERGHTVPSVVLYLLAWMSPRALHLLTCNILDLNGGYEPYAANLPTASSSPPNYHLQQRLQPP
jgi:hypothetical protein